MPYKDSEKKREIEQRYDRSPKGKARRIRYRQSPKGRVSTSGRNARYYQKNRDRLLAQREAKARHLRQALQRLARMKGCVACGTHDAGIVYCWHHYTDEKNFQMSYAWRYSRERVRAELKLAVPMCDRCHKKHHYVERGGIR